MKITTFNLHNLFIVPPLPEGESLKPPKKIRKLANRIIALQSDIVLLQEIGGMPSLSSFADDYLDGMYTPYLVPGNSTRGIELGFLVKKSLGGTAQVTSNKHLKLEGSPLGHFSRDLVELKFFLGGELALILFNVHLKSKRDDLNNDPSGEKQRLAELDAALHLFSLAAKQGVPVVLGGDFNSDQIAKLVEQKCHGQVKDILSLLDCPERWTHLYFDRAKKRHLVQFDYLFIDLKWSHLLELNECGRYVDRHHCELPTIPHQLYQEASDHFPLTLSLKIV